MSRRSGTKDIDYFSSYAARGINPENDNYFRGVTIGANGPRGLSGTSGITGVSGTRGVQDGSVYGDRGIAVSGRLGHQTLGDNGRSGYKTFSNYTSDANLTQDAKSVRLLENGSSNVTVRARKSMTLSNASVAANIK